jgi:hypothetical protein
MLTRRLFAILLALKTPALAQNVVGSSGVGGRVLPLPQQQTPPPPPPSSATVAFALNPANNYMDASFPGLSFEKESMCVPLLWDARNAKLVALLKLISPSITMRFGANEFCKYNASGTGTNYTIGANSEIAPVNIQQLAGFVQALDAKLIYDCPLRGDNYDPSNEAAEIAYVDSLLRPHILFYQFGNEPDLFGAWNNVYWDMWLALQSAAAAAVPGSWNVEPYSTFCARRVLPTRSLRRNGASGLPSPVFIASSRWRGTALPPDSYWMRMRAMCSIIWKRYQRWQRRAEWVRRLSLNLPV